MFLDFVNILETVFKKSSTNYFCNFFAWLIPGILFTLETMRKSKVRKKDMRHKKISKLYSKHDSLDYRNLFKYL